MKNNYFWQNMMIKMSVDNNDTFSTTDFLKETCNYFEISHGFVFEVTPNGTFEKTKYYVTNQQEELHEQIDIKEHLGLKMLSELCSKSVVIIAGEPKNELEQKLVKLFNGHTLILIPILNQYYELAGFVGLMDRRHHVRNVDIDVNTSTAVLSLLANRLKLGMFQKGIANAEQVLNNVLDNIGIDIYVNDYYTHDILYINKSMAKPYGEVQDLLGKKCWKSIFNDKVDQCDFCPQPRLLDENNKPTKTYTWDYERQMDGSWFRVLSSAIPWTDGRIAHIVASVDITENKKNEMLIEKLAKYDHLTGLPNRRSLQDDLNFYCNNPEQFSKEYNLLFCDLDGFKQVNDTLGHEVGDVLLRDISRNLSAMASDQLKVYRHGGDEFIVLLKKVGNRKEFKRQVDDVLKIFKKPIMHEDIEISVGCSIGISYYPHTSSNPKQLIHDADVAMYAAKSRGSGSICINIDRTIKSLDEYVNE